MRHLAQVKENRTYMELNVFLLYFNASCKWSCYFHLFQLNRWLRGRNLRFRRTFCPLPICPCSFFQWQTTMFRVTRLITNTFSTILPFWFCFLFHVVLSRCFIATDSSPDFTTDSSPDFTSQIGLLVTSKKSRSNNRFPMHRPPRFEKHPPRAGNPPSDFENPPPSTVSIGGRVIFFFNSQWGT